MSRERGEWNVRNRRRLLILAENLAEFRRSRDDLRNGRVVKCSLDELFDVPEEGINNDCIPNIVRYSDEKEIEKPHGKPPRWASTYYKYGRERYWLPIIRYWERKK